MYGTVYWHKAMSSWKIYQQFLPLFFACSLEEWVCYTSKRFSIPPSASFHFSFQVTRLTNTYSRTIFALSSLRQYKGLWANFSSPDFLGLFLELFSATAAGLPDGMKAVWAISFKQPRNVYHNCSAFTATMCACAQFTVVVFLRGLWYGFIGCSRCPFGCKCIYLYRSVYTHMLENACVFFIYCNILELSFLEKKKKGTSIYSSLTLFFSLFFFFLSNDSFILLLLLHPSFEPWGFFLLLFPLPSYFHSLFFLPHKMTSSPFSFAILPFHLCLFPHPIFFPLLPLTLSLLTFSFLRIRLFPAVPASTPFHLTADYWHISSSHGDTIASLPWDFMPTL